MTFLEKLDVLVRRNGLNKHSFAKECGIPYTTVDYWYKQNTDKVKLETVRRISAYFGVSLNYWKDSENENPIKFAEFYEYLPYLSKADEGDLRVIRKILGMSIEEKKKRWTVHFKGNVIRMLWL